MKKVVHSTWHYTERDQYVFEFTNLSNHFQLPLEIHGYRRR